MISRNRRPFLPRRPLGLLVCLLPLATPAAHAAKGAGAGLAATPSSTTEESRDHLSLAVMGDEVGSQDLLAAVAKAHPQEIEASLPGASDYEIQENQVANAYETHSISINGADRRYTLTEAGGSKVVLRPGLSGQLHLAPGWDGAILVADATQPASTLAFSLTPAAGVPKIVVFMDRVADLTADELAVFEADLRALLSAYDYDGAQVPILQGSAAGLVNGEPGWEATVSELLAAVDAWIPTPARTVDAPFALTVDEVMAITGRGTVANGVIASGRIHSGDEILIDGASVSVEVEAFRKTQDQGQAGDTVGLLLRGIEKDDIKRGMVIIKHQTSDGETVVDGVQAVPGGVRVQGTYTTDTPLKKGDRVALIGFGSFSVSKKTPNPPVVSDVHGLSIHDRGEAGDNVWLTFPEDTEVHPGDRLGTVALTAHWTGQFIPLWVDPLGSSCADVSATSAYQVTDAEGDLTELSFVFENGTRVLPHELTHVVQQKEGRVQPDTYVHVEATMSQPAPLTPGLRFAVCEGDQVVGAGQVAETLDTDG